MNIAVSVAEWLLGLQHIATAIPVVVQIEKNTFPGAMYTEDRDGTPEERLYLIGELPAPFRSSHKVCFQTADSAREWYIVAWFLRTGKNVEYQECHPFGSHLILGLWSMPSGWTIDKYESKPYRRMPMTMTVLGPSDIDVNQPHEENRNGDGH